MNLDGRGWKILSVGSGFVPGVQFDVQNAHNSYGGRASTGYGVGAPSYYRGI